jgi:hypothetical protein
MRRPLTRALCDEIAFADLQALTDHDLIALAAAVPAERLALACSLSDRAFIARVRGLMPVTGRAQFDRARSLPHRGSDFVSAIQEVCGMVCELETRALLRGPWPGVDLTYFAEHRTRVARRCPHRAAQGQHAP